MDLVCRRWKVGWSSQLESFDGKTIVNGLWRVLGALFSPAWFSRLSLPLSALRGRCGELVKVASVKFHCWSRELMLIAGFVPPQTWWRSLSKFQGEKLYFEWKIFHDSLILCNPRKGHDNVGTMHKFKVRTENMRPNTDIQYFTFCPLHNGVRCELLRESRARVYQRRYVSQCPFSTFLGL